MFPFVENRMKWDDYGELITQDDYKLISQADNQVFDIFLIFDLRWQKTHEFWFVSFASKVFLITNDLLVKFLLSENSRGKTHEYLDMCKKF